MENWIIIWSILFAVVFCLSAFVSIQMLGGKGVLPYKTEQKIQVKLLSDLAYENARNHKYDLYLPDIKTTEMKHKIILFIHGGSYNSGSKEDGKTMCSFYAAKGYVTASLDYSLHKHGYDTNLNEMYEEVLHCVDAIKEKLLELERNHIVPHINALVLSGCSAGGTLALGYAAKYRKESPLPVSNVFTLVAPVDFEPKYWGLLKRVDGAKTDEEFVELMTGHSVSAEMMQTKEYETYIDEISPARLISEDMKEIRIIIGYGLKDHCVPANQKELLMNAMDHYELDYQYFEFPNCNHGMYRDLDIHEKFIEAVLKSLEEE